MSSGDKDIVAKRVLIVDDVESNRMILEEIIKSMGCEPLLAESGEQALEVLNEVSPHLILTDISMPGIDGYELCRILKSKENTREIPVVFISAFDEPEDIVNGFRLGGEDYITKPFIPELVQVRVNVYLRLYEAKQELMEMNRRLQVSVEEQLNQMEIEKKNILYAMANIAAQNAGFEKDHVVRLRSNCRTLSLGMQLSPLFEDKVSDTFIETLELAVPLCDIGNLGIPVDILRRKEDLTPEEETVLKKHSELGADLLCDLCVSSDYNDFISTAIEVVRHHHENWDGSGYPGGLQGDQIPLAAQIVAVVDRYCELTANKSCTREEALAVMAKESGHKFNPDIIEICRKISRQFS